MCMYERERCGSQREGQGLIQSDSQPMIMLHFMQALLF